MSKLAIVLTLSTLSSASAAAYFWQALDDERAQRSQLQARIAELEKARDSIPVSNEIPVSSPVRTTPQPVSMASTPPPARETRSGMSQSIVAVARPADAVDPDMARRMRESREQQMRLLKDPEYRELMRDQHRLNMEHMYSDLGPLLGLSAEESDRLLDVLAEQMLRGMERQRPMLEPNAAPNEVEMREMQRSFAEQRKQNEAEIAAVLGSKYGEWQQYQQSGWARSQVTRLRQSLAMSDEPLRSEQIRPLVDAIAREQQQNNSMRARALAPHTTPGNRPNLEMLAQYAEDNLERTKQAHERIRLAVSGLLSPSQYAQLERQQQHELRMQELQVRQQRARADAQARGELPPDSEPAVNTFYDQR